MSQWLSAADKVYMLEQKQLMLIVENVGRRLSPCPRLYDEILNVWRKALLFMDKIVSGVAQSIESPEEFLGLSSWHLYPNLTVLGQETKHINQNDALIPAGGIVTIGMEVCGNQKERGV